MRATKASRSPSRAMAAGAANAAGPPVPGRAAIWMLSIDTTLLAAWLALVVVGLVMVTSSASMLSGGVDHYLLRHGIYAVGALVVGGTILLLPLRLWELAHRLVLVAAVALCCLVFVPGFAEVINGSRRWISLGPIGLQPGEFAKLGIAIYLAGYLAREGGRLNEGWLGLVKPLFWTAMLVGLIFLQPDYGTVVIIVAVAGGVLFLAGARLSTFFLGAVAVLSLVAAAALVEPYRIARLTSFTDPWAVATDDGYQLSQALIAFGRGGLTGQGLGDGVQKLLYLPEAHNDFIFAVIAEELGLVGGLLVLALLGFVTLRIFRIARDAAVRERPFAAYIAYAAALFIGLQTVVNIGVNTGMLPTKGLTLPFVSYGGNSLLVSSALVAFALRVRMELEAPHRERVSAASVRA